MGEGWNVVSECRVVHLVYDNPEEGSGLIVGIALELGIDLDDECGGDCGKQTSLVL